MLTRHTRIVNSLKKMSTENLPDLITLQEIPPKEQEMQKNFLELVTKNVGSQYGIALMKNKSNQPTFRTMN